MASNTPGYNLRPQKRARSKSVESATTAIGTSAETWTAVPEPLNAPQTTPKLKRRKKLPPNHPPHPPSDIFRGLPEELLISIHRFVST